jgi:Leucine-rich repeat (LRR) protein
MPKMPKLERLELNNNALSGTAVTKAICSLYPDLVTLKLAHNQFDLASVKELKSLSKLESLDVSGNPFCTTVSKDKVEYQTKMREQLKIESLFILDGHDKDGESLESEGSDEEDDAELNS